MLRLRPRLQRKLRGVYRSPIQQRWLSRLAVASHHNLRWDPIASGQAGIGRNLLASLRVAHRLELAVAAATGCRLPRRRLAGVHRGGGGRIDSRQRTAAHEPAGLHARADGQAPVVRKTFAGSRVADRIQILGTPARRRHARLLHGGRDGSLDAPGRRASADGEAGGVEARAPGTALVARQRVSRGDIAHRHPCGTAAAWLGPLRWCDDFPGGGLGRAGNQVLRAVAGA
mmetsp:Transcript_7520/g.19298  ORF Transcript_7520/g.19298 Transcript_7520/m.19298 type:complete len:229 (-) Transcript_7520:411-1097(-)